MVRPLGLHFWGTALTVMCWCELRPDFRKFRPDRMRDVIVTNEPIPDEDGRNLATFPQRIMAGIDGADRGVR